MKGTTMRLIIAAMLSAALSSGVARAATELDLFFPVPVQGKLAVEMQRLIEQFDKDHADIHVTAVYTGSYDVVADARVVRIGRSTSFGRVMLLGAHDHRPVGMVATAYSMN